MKSSDIPDSGQITEHEFHEAIDHFIRISSKLRDTWQIVKHAEGNLKCSYLKRRTGKMMRVSSTCKKKKKAAETICITNEVEKENLENDDAANGDEDSMELERITVSPYCTAEDEVYCHLEHSIVYSRSYSVPVIYFNVFLPGGELLTLEDLWENSKSQVSCKENNCWAFITQQEHPVLHRPFFHLHPCHTAEFMRAAVGNRPHMSPWIYLLSWLSSIAPMVHLDLSLNYANETLSDNMNMSNDRC